MNSLPKYSIKTVKTNRIPILALAKEVGIEVDDTVGTFECEVEISNMPCVLLNALIYVLEEMIPTKRLDNVELETNDMKVSNGVKVKINSVPLLMNTPIGEAKMKVTNRRLKTPLNISPTQFIVKNKDLSGFANKEPIAFIAPGATIEFTAEVIEASAVESNVFHQFVFRCDRSGIKVTTVNDLIEFNDGIVKFMYQGEEKDILKQATDVLKNYLKDLMDGIEDKIQPSPTKSILKIPLDNSGALTNMLGFYCMVQGLTFKDIHDPGSSSYILEILEDKKKSISALENAVKEINKL